MGAPTMQQTMRAEVENVIQQLRPMVQSDGGDLELVDVTEQGVVTIAAFLIGGTVLAAIVFNRAREWWEGRRGPRP